MNTTAASTRLIHTSLPCIHDLLSRPNGTHLCPSVVNPNIHLLHITTIGQPNDKLCQREWCYNWCVYTPLRYSKHYSIFYRWNSIKPNSPSKPWLQLWIRKPLDHETITCSQRSSESHRLVILVHILVLSLHHRLLPRKNWTHILEFKSRQNTDLVAFWQVHLCCCRTINPVLHTILMSALV